MRRHEQPILISPRDRRGRYRLRRGLLAALILLALGVLSQADKLIRHVAGEDDFLTYNGKAFKVVHVVDGDTVDIDCPDGPHSRTRIRLLGVDTPETVKPDTPIQRWGPEASRFAHENLDGQTVTVQLDRAQTRDAHKRLLAYLILPDGRNFSQVIVATGNGYAYPSFDHPLRRQFEKDQKAAMAGEVGLWRGITEADLPDYYRGRLRLKPRPPASAPKPIR